MTKIPTTATELFDQLTRAVQDDPKTANDIGAKIGFVISGSGGGEWLFDLTSSPARVISGTIAETVSMGATGQCTVKISHGDLKTFLADPSRGMGLYFDGLLKITGDINAAGKIQHLFAMLKP